MRMQEMKIVYNLSRSIMICFMFEIIKTLRNVLIRNGKIVIVKGNIKRKKGEKKNNTNQRKEDEIICHYIATKLILFHCNSMFMIVCHHLYWICLIKHRIFV